MNDAKFQIRRVAQRRSTCFGIARARAHRKAAVFCSTGAVEAALRSPANSALTSRP